MIASSIIVITKKKQTKELQFTPGVSGFPFCLYKLHQMIRFKTKLHHAFTAKKGKWTKKIFEKQHNQMGLSTAMVNLLKQEKLTACFIHSNLEFLQSPSDIFVFENCSTCFESIYFLLLTHTKTK